MLFVKDLRLLRGCIVLERLERRRRLRIRRKWVESTVLQRVYLQFELLGLVKVFILNCDPLLLLQFGKLLANRLQAVYGVFDLLCFVKILFSDS